MRRQDSTPQSGWSAEKQDMGTEAVFGALRPLLTSIAYRMLGSWSEAEDIVQEAFVRFHRAARDGVEIESVKAYMTAITTRLGIDHLRSARARRESYVGPWLPDPLVDELAPDVAQSAALADSLSTAFMVMLETLSPVERAVFLLREIFEYGYADIAELIGKSESNCRQIALRARRRVTDAEPRFETSRRERDELAARFFAAARDGDVDSLVAMLAEDAEFHGDGGAKGNGLPRPVLGSARVASLVASLTRRMVDAAFGLRPIHVGGQPGVLLLDPDQRVFGVWSLHVSDGAVRTVHGIVNPDKLGHLGELSSLAWRSGRPTETSDEAKGQADEHTGTDAAQSLD